MTRRWRLFDFRFTRHPSHGALSLRALAIYVNSCTHHYLPDARDVLFGPCVIHYRVWDVHRRMPMLLAAPLTAGFIWLAENIGTFTAAWLDPGQRNGWTIVHCRNICY